ncbi:MAG: hypothetical protein ACE15F_12520 [bacterium]
MGLIELILVSGLGLAAVAIPLILLFTVFKLHSTIQALERKLDQIHEMLKSRE